MMNFHRIYRLSHEAFDKYHVLSLPPVLESSLVHALSEGNILPGLQESKFDGATVWSFFVFYLLSPRPTRGFL